MKNKIVTQCTKEQLKKKKKKNYRLVENLQLYSLCAIPVLLIFIFNYLPMGGIVIAFKDYRYNLGIFDSKWVGFRNFEFFFQSKDFLIITRNTLFLNALFIITGMIAALAVAILLFELKSRLSTKIFQTTLIIPHFLSWVVVAYMAYSLLNPQFGLINVFLQSIGIEAVDWYSMPNAWPAILTVASVWKSVGIDSVIYYASLMAIDNTLFEAAEIDGANKRQQIMHIILPCLKQLIIILAILKIGGIFRADFGLFYQLTRDVGALYPTTDVIDTYIFRTMRVVGNMNMSSAAGLLQSMVGFVLVIITNYFSKKVDADYGLF